LGDGDSRKVGFLRVRGIRRIALKENFSADTMQFGIKHPLLGRTRLRQNLIKLCKRDIRSTCIGFRLSQQCARILAAPPLAKLTQALDGIAHFHQFRLPIAGGPICPSAKHAAGIFPYGHSPCLREVENSFC
jgi:hypothetical protein